MRRPQAAFLRGACSCGWRGTDRYPIDWTEVEEEPYNIATAGPHDDWLRHISEVEARSIPLPAGLEDLLDQVDTQLSALAGDAPLAALRAIAALERTTSRVGREAAYNTQADEVTWDVIGTALGLTEKIARSRLYTYSARC